MKIKTMTKLVSNFIKTHKSEIATGAGIALEVTAIATSINATIKAKAEFDATKDKIDDMWKSIESLEAGEYREMEQKKAEKEEKKMIRKTARKVLRYYVWTAAATVGSIGCYIYSVKNGRKEIRNLSAALAAEVAARNYEKKKAKEILTEDQYNELYHGIKKVGFREGEDGKEYTQYDFCTPVDNGFNSVVGPQKIAVSKHALIFDERCLEWVKNWDYCRTWIRNAEEYCCDKVLHNGYITMNEIREYFGLPGLDECQNLGVVFDKARAMSQVEFEVFEMCTPGRDEMPTFVIDINYTDISGKINQAIRDLNE